MELRKDYILDRWVILSEARKKRPRDFKEKEDMKSSSNCPFCPGSETLTPPEKGRIGVPWQARWFDNLFAFASQKGSDQIQTHNKYYTFGNPYGKHEIIVDNPDHSKQIWDLNENELFILFQAYKNRLEELGKDSKWVALFKNHGKEGGASLIHSHSQIVSMNFIPPQIRQEIEASAHASKGCKYCEIINSEKNSDRRVKETQNFATFTPYASRFNYEVWIFPKAHIKTLNEMDDNLTRELISHFKNCFVTLKKLDLPFNFFFHYAPKGEDLHFHIELTPRNAIWAGFEFTTSVIINSVMPEMAAKVYRGEYDPDFA